MQYFHPNGQTRVVGFYTDHVQDSIWTYYDEEGYKTSEYVYDVKSHNNSIQRDFYLSGALKMQTQFVDGAEEGTKVYYYESGVVKATTQAKGGVKHGYEIQFDSVGDTSHIIIFENGAVSKVVQ